MRTRLMILVSLCLISLGASAGRYLEVEKPVSGEYMVCLK